MIASALFENMAPLPEMPLPEIELLPKAPPAMPVIQEAPQTKSIFDRAVNLTVYIGGISNTKRVSSAMVEVDAEKDRIAVSKRLLESPELKVLSKFDGEIRQYLYKLSLPSILKAGVYLIPMTLVPQVESKMKDFALKRKQLVEDFLAAYPQRKSEAAAELRGLFNESDYPTEAQIRKAFTFEWQYLNFGTPGKLNEISAAFFEEQQSKMQAKVAEAANEMRDALRVGLQELTSHLAERLAPGEDGGKKIFRDTAVKKVKEFLELFDAKNITDDAALTTLIAKSRAVLDGVDPNSLRKNDALRSTVQAGMADIAKQLDGLLTDAPTRHIVFEEDEQ